MGCRGLSRSDIRRQSLPRVSGGGLINGKQVVSFLRGLGVEQPIESYTKRYAAVATDLVSGREIWLESGPIHEAVRASIALPGILSPVSVGGKWLVDCALYQTGHLRSSATAIPMWAKIARSTY